MHRLTVRKSMPMKGDNTKNELRRIIEILFGIFMLIRSLKAANAKENGTNMKIAATIMCLPCNAWTIK